MKLLRFFDRFTESSIRNLARNTSRRSVLSKIGQLAVGAAVIPALPVARAVGGEPASGGSDDPLNCDYWRHCAIDGFLCGCCGGSSSACPPGTELSPITWIGTCRNPNDGKDYVISYNDCCGNNGCGRCFCHNNEGDTPAYMPTRANDLNWCLGTSSVTYNCSLSVVIGVATEEMRLK